ncbi:MAG: type II toxin-antitoxin system HipA family toxin [Bacteroidaceae bacterium]|nr:type II toxin-antitoxin system HipA family toxin [Bacteroidaceae bacterium]
MENVVLVKIWGRPVGTIMWDFGRKRAIFSYDKDFIREGMDIAPLTASIHNPRYRLPFMGEADRDIFSGLPAFIADSLPGGWGNEVYQAWVAEHHLTASQVSPVDKLAFIGKRGMGALEFEPAIPIEESKDIALRDLYLRAQEILANREGVTSGTYQLDMDVLYEVGTSAGGNHAKAVIARNNKTGEIRSGQIDHSEDYTYYLLKFSETRHYPLMRFEMVYYEMAQACNIRMMPSRLIEIDGEYHFLTERYDRQGGEKYHTQSLAAMMPDASSYEDLMDVCRRLHLPYAEIEETYRRAVFNILTTNVDAHIKNFSFYMREGGEWHITPAYDLTFSCFNPGNRFDPAHYLSLNGKRMNINKEDLLTFGRIHNIKNPNGIISECVDAVMQFRSLAGKNGISLQWTDRVERHFAEMTPDLLSGLHGYKPKMFSFVLEDGISVEDAQWQEMGNGAFRLTARMNGVEYRATISPKSSIGKRITGSGGIKMNEESLRQFVAELLLPKFSQVIKK